MNSMLAEYVLAKISTSFNLPVPKLFAINDFALSVLLFLLIYALFFISGKNKLLALIFSTIFCLIFIGTIGRPINPQFSFIFLLLALFYCGIYTKKKNLKNRWFIIFYSVLTLPFFFICTHILDGAISSLFYYFNIFLTKKNDFMMCWLLPLPPSFIRSLFY